MREKQWTDQFLSIEEPSTAFKQRVKKKMFALLTFISIVFVILCVTKCMKSKTTRNLLGKFDIGDTVTLIAGQEASISLEYLLEFHDKEMKVEHSKGTIKAGCTGKIISKIVDDWYVVRMDVRIPDEFKQDSDFRYHGVIYNDVLLPGRLLQ